MKALNNALLVLTILVTQTNFAQAKDGLVDFENLRGIQMQDIRSQIKTQKTEERFASEIDLQFKGGKHIKLIDVQNFKKSFELSESNAGGGWQPELQELNSQNSAALEAVRYFAAQNCQAEFIFTNLAAIVSESTTLNISSLPADVKQCLAN